MLSEEIYERVTKELERVGYDYTPEIAEDSERWNDFCLQIEAMIQYGIEITFELIDRISEVVKVSIYIEPENYYIL